MSLSQMQVFNQYILPATIETLTQMVALFNKASAGAFVLDTEGFSGDFLRNTRYGELAGNGAIRRVNRYATNNPVPPFDLVHQKETAVKVAGGFGPIRYEPSQLTWLDKPTDEGIAVASKNFAEALLRDQVNTAVAALCAAIGNEARLVNDVSAAVGVSYAAINNTHVKFGDGSARIVANVMTGEVFHKLLGQNLTNGTKLFSAGDVTVVDILGKAVVVTDAPALLVAGTPNKSRVLCLTAGAATVFDSQDVVANIETVNGRDRIETTMQVDYSFGLALKGFCWDETNGGKSPTDAALATGANWDRVASSDKSMAGAMLVCDASK